MKIIDNINTWLKFKEKESFTKYIMVQGIRGVLSCILAGLVLYYGALQLGTFGGLLSYPLITDPLSFDPNPKMTAFTVFSGWVGLLVILPSNLAMIYSSLVHGYRKKIGENK